jgi:hypothetical protein
MPGSNHINIFTTNVPIQGSLKNLLDVLFDSNPELLKQWQKKMRFLTHPDRRNGYPDDFVNTNLVSDLNELNKYFKISPSSKSITFSASEHVGETTYSREITIDCSFASYELDDNLKKIFQKYFELSNDDILNIQTQVKTTLTDFYTHLATKNYNKYKARRELSQCSEALEILSKSVITYDYISNDSLARCEKALDVYKAFTNDSKNIFLLYIATSLNITYPRPTQSWRAWMSDFKIWKLAFLYLLKFPILLALGTSLSASIFLGIFILSAPFIYLEDGFASFLMTPSHILLGFGLSVGLFYGFCYLNDWATEYIAKYDYRFDFKPIELIDDLKKRFTHFVEEDNSRSLDNYGLFASSSHSLPSESKEILLLT